MNKTPGVLWLPVIAVIAALLPAAVRGQSQAGGVVILDFLAGDRAGQPVADLSLEDVTLKVGGKLRPLLSLEHVGPTDVPRDIVLLVDEPTLFGLEPVVREAVTALLTSLAAEDRVSYFNTRRPGQLSHQPGHGTVLAGLEAMHTGPGDLWSCVPDMLRAIENIARVADRGGSGARRGACRRGGSDDPQLHADLVGRPRIQAGRADDDAGAAARTRSGGAQALLRLAAAA